MKLTRIIARWEFFDWFLVILIVSFAVGGVAEGIDWMDRRACRVDGGKVELVDHDWRCVRGAVMR